MDHATYDSCVVIRRRTFIAKATDEFLFFNADIKIAADILSSARSFFELTKFL